MHACASVLRQQQQRVTRPAPCARIRATRTLALLRGPALRRAASAARALHGGPRARFEALVGDGALHGGDAAQNAAVDALQMLHAALHAPRPRWGAAPLPVAGVYLHGGVGRGKTALMDLFYGSLAASVPAQRVHSHAWMLSLHAALHAQRRGCADPLAAVAAAITADTRVLCLDELEVTDVADAVLLARLYKALRARGLVLVATSNCAPDALYRGGLNRNELFVPFVRDVRASCAVVCLDGGRDYRGDARGGAALPLYASAAALQRAWDALAGAPPGSSAPPAQPAAVPVPGAARRVAAPAALGRACRFTFEQARAAPALLIFRSRCIFSR